MDAIQKPIASDDYISLARVREACCVCVCVCVGCVCEVWGECTEWVRVNFEARQAPVLATKVAMRPAGQACVCVCVCVCVSVYVSV